jgi:hypothetical protein
VVQALSGAPISSRLPVEEHKWLLIMQSSTNYRRFQQMGGGRVSTPVLASDIAQGAIIAFDITYLL